MSLTRFAVLRGRPILTQKAGEPTPHFRILVNSAGVSLRAAVNARSFDGSKVEYLQKEITGHAFVNNLRKRINRDGISLYERVCRNDQQRREIGMDYLRSGIITSCDSFQAVQKNTGGLRWSLNQ